MREKSIDVLRFIGLSCIILVHCNPPFLITQLRCFDVPLMLFVSGLTCSGKIIPDYRMYVVKRTKRLIIPTWAFVTFYLIFMQAYAYVLHKPLFSLSYIAESYTMTGGIGYVWIMRVFLLIAIITPLILLIERKIRKDYILILSMFMGGGGIIEMMVMITFTLPAESFMYRFMSEWVITILAYSLFFCLGLRMRNLELKKCWQFTAVFTFIILVAFVVYFYQYGLPIELSPTYKYPPHSYYLLYGSFACSLLWAANKCLTYLLGNRLFVFIGQNTIWIYLWHIPLITIKNYIHLGWVFGFILVYTLSVGITYIQNVIVKKYEDKYPILQYLKG